LITHRCILTVVLVVAGAAGAWAQSQDPVGYWAIRDAHRGFTQSVIVIYEQGSTLHGRTLVQYDEQNGTLVDTFIHPELRAEIDGRPYATETDLFWGLEPGDSGWDDGRILDPRNGRTYDCELWFSDGALVLRGHLGVFGRRMALHPVSDADLPAGFELPPLEELDLH